MSRSGYIVPATSQPRQSVCAGATGAAGRRGGETGVVAATGSRDSYCGGDRSSGHKKQVSEASLKAVPASHPLDPCNELAGNNGVAYTNHRAVLYQVCIHGRGAVFVLDEHVVVMGSDRIVVCVGVDHDPDDPGACGKDLGADRQAEVVGELVVTTMTQRTA
jgi:hypothetical protein